MRVCVRCARVPPSSSTGSSSLQAHHTRCCPMCPGITTLQQDLPPLGAGAAGRQGPFPAGHWAARQHLLQRLQVPVAHGARARGGCLSGRRGMCVESCVSSFSGAAVVCLLVPLFGASPASVLQRCCCCCLCARWLLPLLLMTRALAPSTPGSSTASLAAPTAACT